MTSARTCKAVNILRGKGDVIFGETVVVKNLYLKINRIIHIDIQCFG